MFIHVRCIIIWNNREAEASYLDQIQLEVAAIIFFFKRKKIRFGDNSNDENDSTSIRDIHNNRSNKLGMGRDTMKKST